MKLAASNVRLGIVNNGALASQNRVLVPLDVLSSSVVGILAGPDGEIPVYVVPHVDLPAGVVVVGDETAAALGLDEGCQWSLHWDDFVTYALDRIVLEPLRSGNQSDELVKVLERSQELPESIFSVTSDRTEWQLVAQGERFGVRNVEPKSPSEFAIAQITSDTRVELFSVAGQTGLDVVILADCSGSMSIDDLVDERGNAMSRIAAVRHALNRMVELRTRTRGRPARFALLGFSSEARQLFPRHEGLAPIYADMDPGERRQLQDSITLLQTDQSHTEIGLALAEAANLLAKHGKPEHERLIVLLSDGAEYRKTAEKDTGESVEVVRDTVSLMGELHRGMGIVLHPVGISSPTIFESWWNSIGHSKYTRAAFMIPNHELLADLAKRGGGSSELIGDFEVLRAFFSELGGGTSRNIRVAKRDVFPAMSRQEAAQIRAFAKAEPLQPQPTSAVLLTLADELHRLRIECNSATADWIERPLFLETPKVAKIFRSGNLAIPVDDVWKFDRFILDMHQLFWENRDPKITRVARECTFEIAEVASFFSNEDRLFDLNVFRIPAAHDTSASRSTKGSVQNRSQLAKRGERMVARVGYRSVPDHDARWGELQVSLMQDVRNALVEILDLLRAPGRRHNENPNGGVLAIEMD